MTTITSEKIPAAVALGKSSWKSRKKGKTKSQRSEMMRAVSNARFDKTAIPKPNAS
jgi:hypothetical protein